MPISNAKTRPPPVQLVALWRFDVLKNTNFTTLFGEPTFPKIHARRIPIWKPFLSDVVGPLSPLNDILKGCSIKGQRTITPGQSPRDNHSWTITPQTITPDQWSW